VNDSQGEPKNGKPVPEGAGLGGPDPRLAQTVRIVLEVRADGRLTINAPVPPEVCVKMLADAMVAVARIGWKPEEKSLIMPASGVPTPMPGNLRRLP
jgi:hypothetical protein